MQAAQINVAGVVPPKDPTWKNALVKDASTGIEYNVSTAFQAMITTGPLNVLIEPPQGSGRRWKIVGINGQPFQAAPQAPMAPQAPYAPAQQPMQPVAAAVPQLQPRPPAPPRGDLPPIVSNVLAHAVQAGLIKEPHQLAEWAKWIKQAENTYHEGVQAQPANSEAPFDDGLPEQMG